MRRIPAPLLKVLAGLAACLLLGGAAVKDPSSLSIAGRSVGPINAGTRVTVASLKRLFPGYQVTKGADYQEDIKVADTVEVSWKGQKVLVVHTPAPGSTNIHNVEVLSPEVAGPHGIRVGMSYGEIFKFGAPRCRRGIEQLDSFVFCYLPGEPGFTYEGNLDELTPADGYDPANRTPPPAVLSKMKLHGILWRPPT